MNLPKEISMNPKLKVSTLFLSSAMLLTACATDDPNRRAKTGAAIGAIAGAVIGHQAHDERGRYVGAMAGAAAGAAAGNYMDKQQQEMERQLAEEQRKNEIELERVKEDTLKLNLDGEVSFANNSDKINPAFDKTLDKVSGIISQYNETSVQIIGHTDNRGSDSYNQDLSERRALSVANFLSQNGVSSQRITTEGRGELEPRSENNTKEGRELNRRVEILLQSNQS
jgi:outer membrane protein OmpA-like peptidoglycan-associated protein